MPITPMLSLPRVILGIPHQVLFYFIHLHVTSTILSGVYEDELSQLKGPHT